MLVVCDLYIIGTRGDVLDKNMRILSTGIVVNPIDSSTVTTTFLSDVMLALPTLPRLVGSRTTPSPEGSLVVWKVSDPLAGIETFEKVFATEPSWFL